MEQIVNDLIKYFLEEASHPIIDIPKNYVNKREFLRGLINVREVKPVPKEIIEKEDELLQSELKEKNIIDINDFRDRLSLCQGDVTSVKCDAIVNLSNNKLLGCSKPNHNCVANRIHSNAGIALKLKCKEITKGQTIETSKVVLTDGYNLPCRYIIHAVKPEIDIEFSESIKESLINMINNVLDLAKNNGIKTVCIPNITVNSSLKEEVAKVTIRTVKEYLNNNLEIEKVLINTYTLDDYNVYEKVINE